MQSLNNNVPNKYKNLDRYDARKEIIKELDTLNLLEKIEDYFTKLPFRTYRCCY